MLCYVKRNEKTNNKRIAEPYFPLGSFIVLAEFNRICEYRRQMFHSPQSNASSMKQKCWDMYLFSLYQRVKSLLFNSSFHSHRVIPQTFIHTTLTNPPNAEAVSKNK